MSGLSLTKKIIVAFGIVFMIFSFFGLGINFYFNSITSERNNLKDWFDSSVAVSKITYGIATTQRVLYMRVMFVGSNDSEKLKAEQEEAITDVDTAFNEYQAALSNGDYEDESERQRDQEMLNTDKNRWLKYKSEIEKIEPLLSANDQAASINLLKGDIEKAFDDVSKAMNIDCNDCIGGLSDAVDVSEDTFSAIERLIHLIGVLIAVILLIIVAILYFLAKNINRSVVDIVSVTEKAAQGNLSNEIRTEATDEFGTIANQFNSVIDHMRKVLGKVQTAATQVSTSAEKMSREINQTENLLENVALSVTHATDNTEAQKVAINETEERVRRMEKSIEQSIFAMQAGLESVQQTAQYAATGNELAEETVRHMNEIADSVEKSAQIVQELGENSKEIGSIVGVISSIAEQTNLLALNAAIEAARAGEHGRGFAVVSDEVRKLAESSKESVLKIGSIIEKIQATTDQAVEIMNASRERVNAGRGNVEAAGDSFHEIVKMIRHAEENSNQVMNIIINLREPITDIVKRTEKISNMSADIAKKMESISIATAKQAENIVEISDNSDSLNELSQTMETTVHEFQLR